MSSFINIIYITVCVLIVIFKMFVLHIEEIDC
jgi:hypothetical protein